MPSPWVEKKNKKYQNEKTTAVKYKSRERREKNQ
jgi:hypothetical protein